MEGGGEQKLPKIGLRNLLRLYFPDDPSLIDKVIFWKAKFEGKSLFLENATIFLLVFNQEAFQINMIDPTK